MTPHAYLIDVRVRRARDLLRRGEPPAVVAATVGFADQAHLTRVFKARVGIAPGSYRRAADPAGARCESDFLQDREDRRRAW
jgi:AraC-like DNA-binding protein